MFRSVLAAVALTLSAPVAMAGPAAEAIVETASEKLSEGTFERSDLMRIVDTQRIARFALGGHARRIPAEDLERFEVAFEGFLAHTFEQNRHRFDGASVTVIGSSDRNDRDSVVETRVKLPGKDSQTVRWRVIERGGQWRIVDVQVGGLWLAIEERAQIDAVLDRRGASIETVLAALRKGSGSAPARGAL